MIRLHPKALLEEVDNEGFALHMDSGVYYELNSTGYRILRDLLDGASVDDVVANISTAYDVARAQVSKDVDQLLADLRRYELIAQTEDI